MMTDKNHNFKVHNFFSKQKALEDKAAWVIEFLKFTLQSIYHCSLFYLINSFQKKAQDQYEQLNQELQDQREAENNTVAWFAFLISFFELAKYWQFFLWLQEPSS